MLLKYLTWSSQDEIITNLLFSFICYIFCILIILVNNHFLIRFRSVKCQFINFDNVNFDNVNFDNVNFDNVNFDNVNFDDVNFDDVNFDDVNFDDVNFDDVLLLENLLKYGCVKLFTTFCCTHKYFYKIFRKNRDKYYKKLLYLQHILPSYFKKFYKFDENYIFEFNDYKIYTKYYSLVSNSDVCGCVNEKNIVHMKIPAGHFKYISKKGYSEEEYKYQRLAVYYTLYPSNVELVISKSKNEEEKKLLDKDIIDIDYFKNSKDIKYDILFNKDYGWQSNENKYLIKCLKL